MGGSDGGIGVGQATDVSMGFATSKISGCVVQTARASIQ